MSRKTKIFITIVIIIILAIPGLWWLLFAEDKTGEKGFFGGFFGGGTGLPQGEETEKSGGDVSIEGENGFPEGTIQKDGILLIPLTKEAVTGAVTAKGEQKVKYFRRDTGHLYEIPFDGRGETVRLSNLTMPGVLDAVWNSDKSRAIISFLDKNELKRFSTLYVGTSTEGVFLDNGAGNIAFAPAGDKIGYFLRTGTSYSFITSSPDGKNKKSVYSTAVPDFEVSWISNQLLSLKTKSSAFAPSALATLSTSGVFTIMVSEKNGLDVLWSPDQNTFLYSETKREGRDLALFLATLAKPKEAKALSFKTLPEKCAWSLNPAVLYCAIPRDLERSTLPDSWWRGDISFEDVLWKINTATGETSLLLDEPGFDMINLFTSRDENYIFFINKKDSALWSLKLNI